jgi:hypothetical protein
MAGSQVADIVLWPGTNRERIVYLHQWHLIPLAQGGRCIKWEGEIPGVELVHYLPPDTFPQVHHSSKARQDSKKVRQVFFEDKHHLTYHISGQVVFDGDVRPTYTFLTTAFQLEFLQLVRNKTRISWYDTEVIWSDIYHRKNNMGAFAGMARLEKIILWQDKEWPYRHSFSFFSNKTDLQQLEYPVIWFKEAKKTSDTVEIDAADSVPEVITDDEIEAAQMVDAEYGHIELPKYIKIQVGGGGMLVLV